MKNPLIARNEDSIVISHNGKRLVKPLDKYKYMTDEEIVNEFVRVRNIKNNRV